MTLYSFQSQESTKHYKIRKITINRRKQHLNTQENYIKKKTKHINIFQSALLELRWQNLKLFRQSFISIYLQIFLLFDSYNGDEGFEP